MKLLSKMNYWRCQKGETVIGLALVFPIFILIIFEIIELSFVLWGHATLYYVVPKTGRYVFLNPGSSSSQIQNYATSILPIQGLSNFSFTSTTGSTTCTIKGVFTYAFVVYPSSPVTLTVTLQQPLSTS